MNLFSSLKLRRLKYDLSIGVTAEERKTPQPVSVSVELRFEKIPGACTSGNLEQTVGYDRVAEMVDEVVEAKIYELIEPLGYDLFHAIKRTLPEDVLLGVSVHKENPPIEALQEGAEFFLSEWGP